jgi:hypothetical protein
MFETTDQSFGFIGLGVINLESLLVDIADIERSIQ